MPTVQLDPSLIGGNGVNAFAAAYQNALANNQKNQANQQDYELNQFKLDEARAESGRQNALAQLLANAKTKPLESELYGAGGVKGAQTYLKGQGDLAKVNAETGYKNAETQKTQIEGYFKKLELVGQLMGGVTDQASYDQMRMQASKMPELADIAPNMPPQYDPKAIEIGKAKAMGEKDRLAAEHAKLVAAETGRHNLAGEANVVRGQDRQSFDNAEGRKVTMRGQDRQSSDNAASRGVTMRGQNMTDARSRESNAASVSKPFEVTGEDGKPVLVRQDKAGNISRVEGFTPKSATEKPLPEGAQKQVVGTRNLQDAVDTYQSVLSNFGTLDMVKPDSRAKMGNAYNNMMLQAKEAYNLGVLNGPDYDILQSVVKDPTKLSSIATSNKAMSDQAASLKKIAANIERTSLESHGKKYTPRPDAKGADIDALLNKYK